MKESSEKVKRSKTSTKALEAGESWIVAVYIDRKLLIKSAAFREEHRPLKLADFVEAAISHYLKNAR